MGIKWTRAENNKLTKLAGKMPISELTTHFKGRSETAVQNHANSIGLSTSYYGAGNYKDPSLRPALKAVETSYKKWADCEIEVLEDLAGEMTVTDISKYVNRPAWDVRRQAERAGIDLHYSKIVKVKAKPVLTSAQKLLNEVFV